MKLLLICCIFAAIYSSVNSNPVKSEGGAGKMGLLTQGGEDPDPDIRAKRNLIKQMMQDAWGQYVEYAWGNNELKPVSKTGQTGDIFGNAQIGATIVDSLDTLYIMEMMDEYEKARDFVANELNFDVDETVSIFETIIRFVGGFLSAYALTGDRLYVDRAVEISEKLLPGFNSISGLTYGAVNVRTGQVRDHINAIAAVATNHLELTYLSELSGNPIFAEKAQNVVDHMRDLNKPRGLYRAFMNVDTGDFTDDNYITIGGLGDSFFEYLLKFSIMVGDINTRKMYDDAMNAFVDNGFMITSPQSHLLYIAEERDNVKVGNVGHLTCFAGGMFALGAHVEPNNPNAERDAEIGRNFTNTCRESYIRSTTGIGPEVFQFTDDLEAIGSPNVGRNYLLRPEVIESYFIMWRITGDTKYRDWGWDAAVAIERYSKAGQGGGYSGINNVYDENPSKNDVQETFFLAETLKYLYLLFSSNDLISLDNWVFNTECHPLPIKGRNPMF